MPEDKTTPKTKDAQAVASTALFGADVLPCRENDQGEWVPIPAVNELYECRACGHDYPCRVLVTRQKTPYKYIEEQSRVPLNRCVCGEPVKPEWKRIHPPNERGHLPGEKGQDHA